MTKYNSILNWDRYTYVKNILIIKWQKVILQVYSSDHKNNEPSIFNLRSIN